MIERHSLLSDLQALLKKIEADLLERSESSEVPDVGAKLREEYSAAQKAERTAQSFEEWRSDTITQAAVAWVLSCVFVRFLEDNELVETPKIAGPGERLKRARDEHELYFRAHPTLNDRDFLLAVFDSLTKYAATKDVFGEHNPVRDLPNWLSGDAAGELIRFFQRIEPNTGNLVHDFSDAAWDTRFLGDLYQDLSEAARKKYALLQTPVFVEEFILDRTLEPAIEEFGLAKPGYEQRLEPDGRLNPADRFKMIDPACGSGHFLLGSFVRLVECWRQKESGGRLSVLVQRALDSVHGVDLNPYAIAIARFRLVLAALSECSVRRLKDAPKFELHLACGDSLLHGSGKNIQPHLGDWDLAHVYQPEDRDLLQKLLRPGSYHAVVANPPYITPKDRALNQAYRERYDTCHKKYSLAVPFLERIVSLAVASGFTGQITANSFMKREFGKKLVENFLSRVDITHIVDTSRARIPGHDTPTVILLIRNRMPLSRVLRTVLGIRGEPGTPQDPSRGIVWRAIVDQIDMPGSKSGFVSVADSSREQFHKHPWSIGGGGAAELKDQLDESAAVLLSAKVDEIGVLGMTNADEAMLAPATAFRRRGVERFAFRSVALGDDIRDWQIVGSDSLLFPYRDQELIDIDSIPGVGRWLWPTRTVLGSRATFSRSTYFEEGRAWWEWHQVALRRLQTPLTIASAFVSTHNHFALARGEKVFKQTAPIIKLPAGATVEDHLSLLGLLNSSTACFWMKQVCSEKGGTGEPWEWRYEYDGTKVARFPLPLEGPTIVAGKLKHLSERLQAVEPSTLLRRWESNESKSSESIRAWLDQFKRQWSAIRAQMIAFQEELDWQCYRFYGLIEEDLTYPGELEGLQLGQRAFEILMSARNLSDGPQTRWFERHGAESIREPNPDWPQDYQRLVCRRMEIIETNANIALIEQPQFKRRWSTDTWEVQLALALQLWLVGRLESYVDFDGRMMDEVSSTAGLPIGLVTIGRLADIASRDSHFHEVATLYRDDDTFDVSCLVSELVESESVPFLPLFRYKPSGLRKRAEWENTWVLQRREDAIDARTKLPKDDPKHLDVLQASDLKKAQVGTIPVPPKYTSADFLKGDYWRLRGKLDVPKERWVSFPHCEGEDGTLMVAWAGYDHLQLTRAISEYYVAVKERLGGREDPRLVPLLACLVELIPWLKQWHNQLSPEFGVPMGDYFEGFIQEEAKALGLTLDQARAWQPPAKSRGRGVKKVMKKAASVADGDNIELGTGRP